MVSILYNNWKLALKLVTDINHNATHKCSCLIEVINIQLLMYGIFANLKLC